MMQNETSHEPRTRSFQWLDPLPAAKKGLSLAGIDYLKAMSRGELPLPAVFSALDFGGIQPEEGRVTLFFTPQEFQYNPIGSVHGGVISTILDSASACAVHSKLPAGTGYTTLELKVNFLRGIYVKTGPMHCVGTIINLGRRTAVAEGKLLDANEKLYAHCTQTCLILTLE